MKNIKFLITLLFASSNSFYIIGSVGTFTLNAPWILEYQLVDIIDGSLQSKIGFYDGDINLYRESINTHIPDNSCIATRNQEKVDHTQQQRYEYQLQDMVIQKEISNSILATEDERSIALQKRNFWLSYLSFGYYRDIPAPQLNPNLLQKMTTQTRTDIFAILKKDKQFSLQQKRNDFIQNENLGNVTDSYYDTKLHNIYGELQKKVYLSHQITTLKNQIYLLQGLAALTTVSAMVGTYCYLSRK